MADDDCTNFSEGAVTAEECLPADEECYRSSSGSTIVSGCRSCGCSTVQSTVIGGTTYSSCSSCGTCASSGVQVPMPIATPSSAPATKDVFAKLCSELSFPEKGKTAIVKISNVYLAKGQVLYNPDVGSLYVGQVLEEADGIYSLVNKPEFVNDASLVGQILPVGTEFALGVLSSLTAGALSTSCINLVNDFYIPSQGNTSPAKVSSLLGFTLGDKVLLRNTNDPSDTQIFSLFSISGVDTLILKNDGEGGSGGGVLTAKVSDEFVYCLEPLADVPLCEQAVESTEMISLFGCSASGGLQKLQGFTNNEAPVYDKSLDRIVMKVIPSTTQCVTLDTCFQVAPVAEICDQVAVFFTTTDDLALLDAAAEVLLSANAEPQITICGYPFSLDLANSSNGNIRATPTFAEDATISFDENCAVCIPEDCCTQCNPASIYLSSEFFPPGKNSAASFALPYAHLDSQAEFKFSLVKTTAGTANWLRVHETSANGITEVYDELGVSQGIPNDVENRVYVKETVCNQEDSCPKEIQYEEDVIIRLTNIPSGINISVNYETVYEVYECDKIGLLEGLLSTSKSNVVRQFVGPSVQSAVAFGEDKWGVPGPVGASKPYQGTTGFTKRSFVLPYPTCLIVTTNIYLLMKVTSVPSAGDFIFGAFESTAILRSQRI